MTNAKKINDIIIADNIEVYVLPFRGNTKGMYGDNVIAISDSLVTESETLCILAEEVGHHKTSYGNVLDKKSLNYRKQEHLARGWAYKEIVSLPIIIEAFGKGCRSWYDIAEYLEVTEEFLKEAVQYFKNKYGIYKTIDNYIIYFEPLGVMEIL